MIAKDISFASVEENIRYDESLLECAENGIGGETLRFWEGKDISIVLGRACKEELEIKKSEARDDGVKIAKRMSGGGTVLQGPGCLNYALVLSLENRPELKDIKRSYQIILERICTAFSRIGVKAEFEPISDVTTGGRKFSGNAQWRRKKYMLHHGTVLYDFPIDKIEQYLKMPPVEPPYRKGRSHSEFLCNVGLKRPEIKNVIGEAWGR
ncbi:MAG: lipoate--protein ligase family protein [Candidatus Omnitrophota bacterium]